MRVNILVLISFGIIFSLLVSFVASQSIQTNTVQVKAKLVLEEVVINPQPLQSGDIATISVTIRNVGAVKIDQLDLELVSTSILTPILNRGYSYLDGLLTNETKQATFLVSVDKSAEQKTYTSILKTTYISSGEEKEKPFNIGISVNGDLYSPTGLATGGSGLSAAASVIVLIVLVAYVFFRRKKILRKLGYREEED